MLTPMDFNQRGVDNLPGHLGIVITHVDDKQVRSELPITKA